MPCGDALGGGSVQDRVRGLVSNTVQLPHKWSISGLLMLHPDAMIGTSRFDPEATPPSSCPGLHGASIAASHLTRGLPAQVCGVSGCATGQAAAPTAAASGSSAHSTRLGRRGHGQHSFLTQSCRVSSALTCYYSSDQLPQRMVRGRCCVWWGTFLTGTAVVIMAP